MTGITARPAGKWAAQQARNLRMGGELGSRRFIICDRDTKFTSSFDEVFRAGGIRIIRTPV
jgi:hypothetical protein